MEEALKGSEQRLADIIDFLPDATLVIDREGKVIAWNHAMEAMVGVKAKDMLGKGNYEYAIPFYGERRPILIDLATQPQEEIEKRYTHIEKRPGGVLMGENYIPNLKGGEFYFFGAAAPLYDQKGNLVGAIECIRDITERKRIEEEREKLIRELQDALANIKTLHGLLPICSYCKKIRDDKGYWNRIESYIQDHSGAEFTHGMCPECLKKLYPDFVD
jgi:PAS domain S-box-containing protein